MKIAIMQPYFFPYIGYFQLIHSVDTFVLYDNIHSGDESKRPYNNKTIRDTEMKNGMDRITGDYNEALKLSPSWLKLMITVVRGAINAWMFVHMMPS